MPIDLTQYNVSEYNSGFLYRFEQWPTYLRTASPIYLKGGRVAEILPIVQLVTDPLSSHSSLKVSKQETDSSNGPPRIFQVKGQLPWF